MAVSSSRRVLSWLAALTVAAAAQAGGVAAGDPPSARPLAANVVVPQRRVFAVGTRLPVHITEVAAEVAIIERVATTALDVTLMNPAGARQEAELLVPVPDGAVVRGFAFEGAGKEAAAELLPADDARRVCTEIVSRLRDPALLEFVGSSVVRSSRFPVDARSAQKVRLTYETLLPADGCRVDYVLPRTESVAYTIPWKVKVGIRSRAPVSTVYSPSHKLDVLRISRREVAAEIAAESQTDPGAFHLSYLAEQEGISGTLFAYPEPQGGGGYFLLLAGLPARPPAAEGASAIRREITMVLDRSGSMGGEKIEQVRAAASQVIAGLQPGEAFNILVYNERVDRFADRPVLKSQESEVRACEFLAAVKARGGTNLREALLDALRPKPIEGFLPMVLFLTDGLPTVGETSEVAIRDAVLKANPHQRRVFTFGVGTDVNTALLERVALETRGTSTFVLPNEDVKAKVSAVFRRLAGPVLADAALEVEDPDKTSAPGRVLDMIPARLPDLFEGDQLVVLGRYVGGQPLTFCVSGNYLGQRRTFPFTFELSGATIRNAFVPRLWASRKLAVLVDAIRALGADLGSRRVHAKAQNPRAREILAAVSKAAGLSTEADEARLGELVREVVRLSTEFGILTEYTAFLAREGTDLTRLEAVVGEARANLENRAMNERVGLGSISQEVNRQAQRNQLTLNYANAYYDPNMERVAPAGVQQVNDRAFFHRGDRWVDAQVVADQRRGLKAEVTIEFGSPAYWRLVERLASESRPGALALPGELLLRLDGRNVLITAAEGRAARTQEATK